VTDETHRRREHLLAELVEASGRDVNTLAGLIGARMMRTKADREFVALLAAKSLRLGEEAALRRAHKSVLVGAANLRELEKTYNQLPQRPHAPHQNGQREAPIQQDAEYERRRAQVLRDLEFAGSILRTWTVAGRPLGQATGETLIKAAEEAEAKATGQLLNATFYRRLAERLPTPTDCVEEVLTVAEVLSVKEKVYAPVP
jgi:hypothetical protein